MGDKTTITDRGAEGRITGYGDRVVAQGEAAMKPPTRVVPTGGGKTPAEPPYIAQVTIYDKMGAFKKDLGEAIAAQVERELNTMHQPGKKPGNVVSLTGVAFEVRYLPRMSTPEERVTGRLDFPVYFLNAHSQNKTTQEELRDLLLEHGIRDSGPASELFKIAKEAWDDGNIEGFGIPPLVGFKKVAVIKHDQVMKKVKGLQETFANVVRHELGHCLGITTHAKTGVMREGIMLNGGQLDYTSGNLNVIIGTLVRLAKTSEAELARRYVQQNP